MHFIDLSFTISHEESIHVVRMKPADLQWISKGKLVLPWKQMKKVPVRWKKLCEKDILFPTSLMGHSVSITSELVVQTLLINSIVENNN